MGNKEMKSNTTKESADTSLLDGLNLSSARLEYLPVPNCGIWHLTIPEAAELVALDMWGTGTINIEGSSDWDGEHDPRLLESLSDHIAGFETRLLDAIDSGHLIAPTKRRDFNDRLVPDDTYIEYGELSKWLDERHYERGDLIAAWVEQEAEFAELTRGAMTYRRAAQKLGIAKKWNLDDPESYDMTSAFKILAEENRRLKEQLVRVQSNQPAKVDRPLLTRERRTLLTIIAAFCKYESIDPKQRGTPTDIAKMTDDLDAPVTAETIAKVLAEIPDALETRMK